MSSNSLTTAIDVISHNDLRKKQHKPWLQLETTPVHLPSWQRSCHVCRDV